MEAFDLDEVKKAEGLPEDKDFYWDDDLGVGLEELTIDDGLIFRAFGIHELGLEIELWRYKDKSTIAKKKFVEKIITVPYPERIDPDLTFHLLRFIPENIPDFQKEAEEWLEQKPKIDFKTWLEQ